MPRYRVVLNVPQTSIIVEARDAEEAGDAAELHTGYEVSDIVEAEEDDGGLEEEIVASEILGEPE